MYFLASDFGILLSLNLIFYIILGLAILSGFISGFKKSLFKLITMIIFYIIFFFTLDIMVGVLWKVDLSFLGGTLANIDPSLGSFTSFESSYESILELFLGDTVDFSQMSANFMELASGLMQFVLKIVWTVLYFTVILIFYKIICWIIRAIFIKKREGANKHRLFGALIGAGNGLLAIFIALIMLGGMMSFMGNISTLVSAAQEMQSNADNGDNTQNVSFIPRNELYDISYSLLAETTTTTEEDTTSANSDPNAKMLEDALEALEKMVAEYESNLFVGIANSITVPSVIDEDVEVPLHINLFDMVLSFEQNDKTVALRYEIDILTQAFMIFTESEFQETQELTDLKGDEIRDMFQTIANSKLIVSLVPVAIEYAALESEKDLPFPVEELYDGTIDFEQELATMGRIGGTLFDILNGAGFIGGEGSVDQIEVTGDTVRDLFSDISGSDIIVLITETLLLPELADSEGSLALIIEIPSDLDLETEFLAIGEIFAEIVEADIEFKDIMGDDITTTLKTLSSVDLTVLLESRIVTEALINILSGEAEIEGLSMLSVPADINWYDEGVIEGELRKILNAIDALLEVSENIDFDNLDAGVIADMDFETISTFFDSQIIRATVTDIFKGIDFGDMPLIFPDIVYDDQDYFTKSELVAVSEAIKLIIVEDETETSFDPLKVLNLTDTEVDTLLTSNILYATIGNYFNTIDTSEFQIPDEIMTDIMVDQAPLEIVNRLEQESLFKALSVLEITDFSGFTFDATFIDKFENTAGNDLEQTKIDTLLASKIIHATVSKVVIDLDKSNSGPLVIPNKSIDSQTIITSNLGTDYITTNEISNIFKALYKLEITDFNSVELNNLNDLKDHFSVLLDSAIIHATISDVVLNIGSTVVIPENDSDDVPVIVTVESVPYITESELQAVVDGMKLLGLTDPNTFSDFSFSVLNTDNLRYQLLDSAILHATITDQMMTLGGDLLTIPEQDELGNDLIIESGTKPDKFVAKSEINAILKAMIEMGYSDVNDLSQEINPQVFIDNMYLVLASASMQATVSKQILAADEALVVPEKDSEDNQIKIPYTDVTFIKASELENLFEAIELFNIQDLDFNTFDDFTFSNLDTDVKRYQLMDSAILHATVSDQLLGLGGSLLKVPEQDELGNDLIIETGTITVKYVAKAEINAILKAMIAMGYTDVKNLTTEIDPQVFIDNMSLVLDSASMQATVSNQILAAQAALVIPERDSENNLVKIPYTDVTFIESTELENFFNAINLFGITDLDFNTFNSYNFSALNTDTKRMDFMKSAILHATISDQLFDLGSNLLIVPEQDESGNDLILEIGVLPNKFVVKTEINAIMKVMIEMGYTDVNNLSSQINAQAFIDNMDLVLDSASMHATVSNQILNASSSTLIIPDEDLSSNSIRIPYTDVTYISSSELSKFFTSIDLLAISNLDFGNISQFGLSNIQTLDKNVFFDSFIMLATVSDYFLDAAVGDETHAAGTISLLIPSTKRFDITVETLTQEAVDKNEMIRMLDAFQVLGLGDYNSNFDASVITSKTSGEIDQILLSDSIHITVDSMLRGNAQISGKIPALAEDTTTYVVTVTTKSEIRNFILASQQVTGASFTTVSFDIYAVAGLNASQRDIVLDSWIVRNILTPELENLGTVFPFSADPYVFTNNDYMNLDPTTFLTEDSVNLVFAHYGLV
ncbi:MAG: hypothetical protein PHW21_03390 [Candidatus Izemoplasmatales bacterium]|nr:hypothetical protein [Candidatus Izemoplasmatales bacterium]